MPSWGRQLGPMPDMKGPIARGTIRTTVVLGLRLLVQAGTLLLVARLLGPDQFGAFAGVAALAVMLGTLATFGTHLVLLGEVSKDSNRRAQVLHYAVPSTLICGGLLLATYTAVSMLALREASVPIAVLIAIGVTETVLQPLFTLPAMEFLALGRIARSQLLQTLPLVLRLVAAATVFLLHPIDPLAAYGYGYLAASVIALGIATLTMPAPWPSPRDWHRPSKAQLREAVGYAALNITATTPTELDKTLAIKLLPLPAAGLYAAGARVIGAATLPVIAMMLSALPRLFREGQDRPKRTDRLLRWIFVITLVYSTALAILLWFIAPGFAIVFGPKYQGIQHMIHWLCLAIPGMALRTAAGNVLLALGKPWARVGFEATGLLVLVVASVVLTKYFSEYGMPLALASSEWMMVATGAVLIAHARTNHRGFNEPPV